jgi:hypothetical protein
MEEKKGNFKGNREKAAARRLQALELRKGGASYRQIGERLGVSDCQAHNDVSRCLDNLSKLADDVAGHLRTMEEARLDALLLAVMPQARQGNLGAVDRVVRIMERRARLLGLDAPTKIAPTDPTGEYEYSGIGDAELFGEVDKLLDRARTRETEKTHAGDAVSLDHKGPA